MISVAILLAALMAVFWVCAPPLLTSRPGPAARAARRASAGRLEVARMVEQLATVISSGAGVRQAWAAVAHSMPEGELAEMARAAAAGADPRRAASGSLARSETIGSLGAALSVCERTGAPTAGMLQSLADALRDLHDAAQARRSAFTGPRSTAKILLVLPLAGLGLGVLLGGDPLRLLVSSPSGHLLGALGIALTGLGWWWMQRLIHRADPPETGRVDPSVVLELIAGALDSGLPLARSVGSVALALPSGPDEETLGRLAGALDAGLPAVLATAELPSEFTALGQSAVLAESAGADLARVLRSAARDARRGRARDAEVRAAQLAVRLVLPTGVALLPAFVVLGIIPTVISLLGGTFALTASGAAL
ncbi:type II secretion system F family protein [Brachybacterium alimentarium]|uniref:type II secretion system F family protein n=1 Tax=Brachybacterium alimentarium TaxID=47845 RepID=UPI000BB85F9A|nr:type II secretion system F family protein [Brachybacterium alimentarium]PCC33048.1 pilus assembly protein TadB [Brachybacterium alimentarium]RCS81383.1 pilus assembly protein TadB [Brachybacterium alimentarium]RCS83303.1 pilus assembly protein TadB [Brachybacterium alimentarium]